MVNKSLFLKENNDLLCEVINALQLTERIGKDHEPNVPMKNNTNDEIHGCGGTSSYYETPALPPDHLEAFYRLSVI